MGPTEASHNDHIQTAPKEPPSPQFLCQDCVNLDLSGAFSVKSARPTWGYFNNWAVNVGHRYRVMRTTNCNLCQMLYKSRVDKGDLTLDGDVDWIRAVSFVQFAGLSPTRSQVWISNDFPILMLLPHKSYDLSKNYERVKDRIRLSGYAGLRQLNQQQAVPLSLKAIPPAFDLRTFKNWFNYCNCYHGSLCRYSKSYSCGTHVIDCQEQSITERKPSMPYVALSYVWGQPQEQREVVDGKRLPAQLPLLIRDAMAVTQAMGFRYLWVDRYCIDQNNPTVKHEQIRQMDAIYSNAEVTIIAAAGQDENYGLSGVGRNRPATQTAHIGDVAVVWAPKDPQAAIKASKWSTRGWTFQEALLSRRRLVFTEQQAYFECSAMNIYESLDIPFQNLHILDRSRNYEYPRWEFQGVAAGRIIFENQKPSEVFNRYLSNVEKYSARKLSYAEDSLNAFRGIAQRFWYVKHAVCNIWGLAYYPTRMHARTDSFLHSLSWCHTRNCWDSSSQSPQRRPQFPSWSWAGWEGEIRYQIDSSGMESFRNLIRAVSFENQNDSPIALEMIEPNPDETCIFPVMILTGAVVPAKLISFIPNAASDEHWQIGKNTAHLALSYGSMSESQFAEDLHDSQIWQCICVRGIIGELSVMILKTYDGSDLWERAGMFVMEGDEPDLQRVTETLGCKSFRIR